MRRIGLLSLVLLACSAPAAAAQQPSYYALPEGSDARAITSGPDGAVWFAARGTGRIGRLGMNGTLSEFVLPRPGATPTRIAAGRDAIYYTDGTASRVGRLGLDGSVEEVSVQTCPAATCGLRVPDDVDVAPDGRVWFSVDALFGTGAGADDAYHDVCSLGPRLEAGECTPVDDVFVPTGHASGGPALGPDNAMWLTNKNEGVVGRIPLSGPREVEKFPLPQESDPDAIVAGPDRALWFAEGSRSVIGRISTSGVASSYALPRSGSGPAGITAGPDGNVWFTEAGQAGNAIGRITPRGTITEFPLPQEESRPSDITTGPDAALWFTESANDRIGRLVPPAAPGARRGAGPAPPQPAAPAAGAAPDRPPGPAVAQWAPALSAARLTRRRVAANARRISVRLTLSRRARVAVRLQRAGGVRRLVARARARSVPAGSRVVHLRVPRGALRPGRHHVVVEVYDGRALASRTTLPLGVRSR